MFAMVLAIGLLVDDAIVVVENVERVMTEENLSPLEAKVLGCHGGCRTRFGYWRTEPCGELRLAF